MVNFNRFSLLMIFLFWTKESTGTAFSIEEEIQQLKLKMAQLEENDAKMKLEMTEFKLKDFQMEEKVAELESKNVEMQEKVNELEEKVKEQDSILTSLLQEKKERMKTNSAISQSAVGLPSSCGDLKMIGHTLNGFYSVMGSAMMESVYCDFTKLPSDAGFEKWIGYTDVKSAPVNFYVQRNSSFSTMYTPIPFDLARVNDGNAMDLATGKFTAPRNGIFFFSFTGHASLPASTLGVHLEVYLYLNGGVIGVGYVSEANTVANLSPLTLQSTLNLKKEDQVWVGIWDRSTGAYLSDDGWHRTHFTGFMLEEEIVASLL